MDPCRATSAGASPAPRTRRSSTGQVFFRLLESLERIDSRKGSVLVYALSMARNALVDEARRRTGRVPEDAAAAVPDPVAGPLEHLMGQEDVERIRGELARLPAETRELLRELARQRLIEELRRQEGEGADIDVDVEDNPNSPKLRVRVRKKLPEPAPPPP